ncbi:ribosome maturation factor RimM [Croceicoccus naphthovorans]|uniref:Ribosome maturation factor RimM n=1 Tax=Croceicoccus naphthovorans TaxID=1348774 RepID=A0A0G3XIZ2_9SPHN|nr:ribosome maturation factor RimM [Croceicoccus naphthovorans]AKM10574.1 ribosome maturation factor RimM [Croceicoccus naphthovorans]MBB3988785.1 16S rRNA processing protein RimM [Croceicoccus naphthovorans]
MDRTVTLAAITGAHGVAGEVRLKLFGEGVESLKGFRAFRVSKDGALRDAPLTATKIKDDGKGGAIARFAEVTDRNAAEALRGSLLTVPREDLPALGEGEYYHADLLGLAAVSEAGEPLGTVIAVENYGAGDVIEIERPAGSKPRTFMVPMHEDAVREWDGERMIVTDDFAQP